MTPERRELAVEGHRLSNGKGQLVPLTFESVEQFHGVRTVIRSTPG